MKRFYSLSIIILLFTLSSCKTQEEIRREQLVDQLSTSMRTSQDSAAEQSSRILALEESLGALTGKLDEVKHHGQKTYGERLQELEGRIGSLEETNLNLIGKITTLEEKTQEQSDYIKEVLSSLKKMTSGSKKKSNKSKGSLYSRGISSYKKGHYKSAKKYLTPVFEKNLEKGSKRARTIHSLGMIAYMDKKYDIAQTYFSKLYTEFPTSGYNKNGLYHLALSFKKAGEAEKGKLILNELIGKFPKAKEVKKAKKLLGDWK